MKDKKNQIRDGASIGEGVDIKTGDFVGRDRVMITVPPNQDPSQPLYLVAIVAIVALVILAFIFGPNLLRSASTPALESPPAQYLLATKTTLETQTVTLTPYVTPTAGATLSEPVSGKNYVNSIDGATYVHVPAGDFIMGSSDEQVDYSYKLCMIFRECERVLFENEQPQHIVYLDEYWIMETEVTNAQYRKFVEADGYTIEAYWHPEGWLWRTVNEYREPRCWDESALNGGQQPVACVSWYEAVAYANWLAAETGLDIGLPTEAQWEKAARGSDGRHFPWGDEWDSSRVSYCEKNCRVEWPDKESDDGYPYSAPVGNYPLGASPYGALDMVGNVWEWTADWYDDGYDSDSYSKNPTGPENGEERVWRGGSWHDNPSFVCAACRFKKEPENTGSDVGFRLRFSSPPD